MIPRTRSVVVVSLGVLCLGLVLLGMIVLLSASATLFFKRGIDANVYRYLGRQLMWFAVGLVAMSFAYSIDHSRLQNKTKWFLALTIVFLGLCFVPPFGVVVNKASRWVQLGPIRFQPSDLAKITVVLYLADIWSRKADQLDRFWRGVMPSLLILGLVLGLILVEPDKGTAIFIAAVAGCMWFIAGARPQHMLAAGGSFAAVAAVAITSSDYAWRRVIAWLHPEENAAGAGWQVWAAQIAMARGGLTGVGLGEGQQQLGFMPEVHTDFIFSVLAEELGFIASVFLIVAFGLIVGLALLVAWQSSDRFGALLAAGCGISIGLQAALNLLVVTGTIPTTGISLPFISYGGSGLVMSMVMVGLIASVAQASLLPESPSRRTARGSRVRVGGRAANRPTS